MTLLEKLTQANLPVIHADESGAVIMGKMTDAQEAVYRDILLQHFSPATYNATEAYKANVQSLREEYQNAVTTLQSIQDASTLTNAQVLAAVKFLAKVLLLVLKILRQLLS